MPAQNTDPSEIAIAAQDSATWDALAWAEELPVFASVAADARDPEDPVDTALVEFDGKTSVVTTRLVDADVEEGWTLPLDNSIGFSRDGERLFFGLREREPEDPEEEEETDEGRGVRYPRRRCAAC